MSIADIRKEYLQASLVDCLEHPFDQFNLWFTEAQTAGQLEVNAMTLSTVNSQGRPRARVVLLKELTTEGFVFFTNYQSHKGQELEHHPYASLVFFWPSLERQVRVEGQVTKLSPHASDDYFNSRPYGSKIGAWVSNQSEEITDRNTLIKKEAYYQKLYPNEVPRPPHWGGYCLTPDYIEFWQGRPSRLHDRIVFERVSSGWTNKRLSP